jgi:hypothetical protein
MPNGDIQWKTFDQWWHEAMPLMEKRAYEHVKSGNWQTFQEAAEEAMNNAKTNTDLSQHGKEECPICGREADENGYIWHHFQCK